MEFEKLKAIISQVMSVDPNEITMDTLFVDDLSCDSIEVFQIIMGIEEEFGIQIPTDEIQKIHTVSDAVEKIKSLTNG